MNIRITTFSVLFAATCALSFNTAAQAGEDEEGRVHSGSMRFTFDNNTYPLDHVQSRHHYMSTSPGPGSVHSGAAPKNLLGLDPGFLAKPAPLPVAPPPVAVAQPTVSAKPIIANSSPFSALFNHPSPALSAPAANAGQFGHPAAAKPQIASLPPQTHPRTAVAGRVLRPHPTAAAARTGGTPIASYNNQFYIPGAALPGYGAGGGGNVTTTNLQGSVIGHKH
jgi:hypothetical protein